NPAADIVASPRRERLASSIPPGPRGLAKGTRQTARTGPAKSVRKLRPCCEPAPTMESSAAGSSYIQNTIQKRLRRSKAQRESPESIPVAVANSVASANGRLLARKAPATRIGQSFQPRTAAASSRRVRQRLRNRPRSAAWEKPEQRAA